VVSITDARGGGVDNTAFYAGWPNAVTAIGVAREIFEKK
jgi:alkylhydroperoxidase/carboxymuconolactone decarboxylase family protein YurZ